MCVELSADVLHENLLCHCRFRVTRGNTCMLGHQERDVVVMVRGDDFVSTADIEDQH